MNINEIYTCIQGEGKYAGIPHILVRTTGCALRCQFKDTFCDTPYSSWMPEKGKYMLNDIEQLIIKNPQIKYAMLTGGGPTLRPQTMTSVVNLFKKYNLFVTVETEGSAYVESAADFISLSPKLSNSTPKVGSILVFGNSAYEIKPADVKRHERNRKNYDAMRKFIQNHDYQIKFVVSDVSDISEIKETLDKIGDVPNNKVYLMPEGVTTQDLRTKRREIMEICIKEGWNYTDRLHILAYGDKRGV